jgi:hypothetical protein
MSCYNAEMAEYAGVEFEDPRFQPVVLTDADEDPHEFHFVVRLLGDRVVVDAHEVQDGVRKGYEFQHIEYDPEAEPFEMLGKLLQKMRRHLSRRHVEMGELGWSISGANVVRARIDSDLDTSERLPLVVIDGREFSWDQLGHMLMSYEGWQFKMEIKEPSDEV